jgi:hypothetical protein
MLRLLILICVHITVAHAICTCEDFAPHGVVATCYGRWSMHRSCIGFTITLAIIESPYRSECPKFGTLLYDTNITVLIQPSARRICKTCASELDLGNRLIVLGCPAKPTTAPAPAPVNATVVSAKKQPETVTVLSSNGTETTNSTQKHKG